jgi:hypothetical protein
MRKHPRMRQSGHQRFVVTEVPRQIDDADMWIAGVEIDRLL